MEAAHKIQHVLRVFTPKDQKTTPGRGGILSIGSSIGRQIIRGVLGSLFGRRYSI